MNSAADAFRFLARAYRGLGAQPSSRAVHAEFYRNRGSDLNFIADLIDGGPTYFQARAVLAGFSAQRRFPEREMSALLKEFVEPPSMTPEEGIREARALWALIVERARNRGGEQGLRVAADYSAGLTSLKPIAGGVRERPL
jgi:hypothetical protein